MIGDPIAYSKIKKYDLKSAGINASGTEGTATTEVELDRNTKGLNVSSHLSLLNGFRAKDRSQMQEACETVLI
ncbi:MAG: hypothetical protein J5935_00175 [Lachnospiraceae bacterium]|nr:hypothetical protein [Lachnospiraceae bacterium]